MSVAFKLEDARLSWLSGDANEALRDIRAVKDAYEGRSRDAATGLELDILEHRGELGAAAKVLQEATGEAITRNYWDARAASLSRFPYGPYGIDLNQSILDLRRNPNLGDGPLLLLKSEQAARLPFLVSVHPAFARARMHSSLRELLVAPLLQS